MMSSFSAHEVWAVITTYRPARVPRVISQVRDQVAGIVVVDDGSGVAHADVLAAIRGLGAEVVALPENSGIGAALNRGMRRARELHADAVVTFDQDSEIPQDFVQSLLVAHLNASHDGVTAGPVVPEFFADVRQAGRPVGSSTLLAAHAIQSGMLIPASVLDRVGDMDEGLFIDLVDTDFELRCTDAGVPCIVAPDLRLQHHLGARYKALGPLGNLLPPLTLSTPFRYYYRARNRIIVDRRHRPHRSRLLRDRLSDNAYFLIALALARPRRNMWRILRQAKADGRQGRSGAMPAELRALAADISWRANPQPG